MNDPLKGQRRSILEGKVRVAKWPHDGPCPVKVGDTFTLGRSCVIEITRVRESLKGGLQESLWIAEFIRHEKDKVYLLRAAPPAHADHEERRDLDAGAIKRAAVESAYTSSQHGAVNHEPESVGPDWVDKGKAEREAKRQEERRKAMTVDRSDAEVDRAADTLKRVGKQLGRNGVDLTDTLSDLYAKLAAAQKEAA